MTLRTSGARGLVILAVAAVAVHGHRSKGPNNRVIIPNPRLGMGSNSPKAGVYIPSPLTGMMDRTMIYWDPKYGECDSKCGSGRQFLESVSCKHVLKGLMDDWVCRDLSIIQVVDEHRECTGMSACRWQCRPREDGCGWPEVSSTTCINNEQPDAKPDRATCASSDHLPSDAEFTRDQCRQTACAGGMRSTARVVTVNHLDNCKSSTGRSGLLPLVQEMYNGEDLVVLATQELVGKKFSNMMSQGALSELDLVKVDSCSEAVSASIALYVKSSVRHLYAPISDDCVERSGQSSWTNTKGTMVMGVQTVFTPLVLASSHGARAGTFSQQRVDEFEAASSSIMALAAFMKRQSGQAPAIFWGGDFNPRTYVTEQSVLYSGTTHPASRGVKDKYSGHVFNASQAFVDLQGARRSEDIFGGLEGGEFGDHGRTVDELLRASTRGALREVPGLERLCPSYYKADGPGHTKTPFVMWGEATPKWKPNWACLAPGSTETEYYDRTKWKSTGSKPRTPSWADRIFTNANCDNYQKLTQTADHDIMHTRCDLSGIVWWLRS